MDSSLGLDSSIRRTIILFGDSNTQFSFSLDHKGWGCGLADWYQRTADVINRGYSGYNSRWALSILRQAILSESALYLKNLSLATICFGANDSCLASDGQHVPLDEYRSNIEAIIDCFRQCSPNIRLVLITPPPVNHVLWPTRHNDFVSQYANAVRSIGECQSVSVLDLWTGDNCIFETDLHDGLHFSLSGNEKIFRGMQSIIRERYPSFAPDYVNEVNNLQLHLPVWRELSGHTAEETEAIIENWKWTWK